MDQRFIRLFTILKTPARFTLASVLFSIVLTLIIMLVMGSDRTAIRFGLIVATICSAIASYVFSTAIFAFHTLIERKNRQLANAIAELEQRNADLEAFAHSVAHDLKSPLSLISGYADMLRLRLQDDDPDIEAMVDYMWRAGYKMEEIIDSLLLLASVSRETVQHEPLDMQELFFQSQERLRPLIEESRAQFEVPAEWPVSCGYAPWVEGIWVQYVSNALKYGGSPPSITVGATDNGDGTHTYFVQDAGPGIAIENQRDLFEEFSRLEQETGSGNGLGLSIVRRIATKLHGDAGVESEPGRGSCFYFTLPAAVSADEQEYSASDSPNGNPRLSCTYELDERTHHTMEGHSALSDT